MCPPRPLSSAAAALSHVRKILSASVFSISGFNARSPSDLTPFSTAGSHRQVSDSGTATNRFPACRATNGASSYPVPSGSFSVASVNWTGPCAEPCQLRARSSLNVIPTRNAPVPSMWIQCLRWRCRHLGRVQQRRHVGPFGEGERAVQTRIRPARTCRFRAILRSPARLPRTPRGDDRSISVSRCSISPAKLQIPSFCVTVPTPPESRTELFRACGVTAAECDPCEAGNPVPRNPIYFIGRCAAERSILLPLPARPGNVLHPCNCDNSQHYCFCTAALTDCQKPSRPNISLLLVTR
jgi:hypothetical protein